MFPLLDTLVAVYEIGQFTLAADELKVSQSTVSSRIAQLERMVGAPLFVRNAKSDVTPTEAGRLLYRAATGIDGSGATPASRSPACARAVSRCPSHSRTPRRPCCCQSHCR